MAIDQDELNDRPRRLAGDPGLRRTPGEHSRERGRKRGREHSRKRGRECGR
ncbi:MAG TPA: hypothetical protein VKD66_09155 [Streptosporangiaceae bacterium]|nr:hypothetical protein [Streptosporangiaceae bacterium]